MTLKHAFRKALDKKVLLIAVYDLAFIFISLGFFTFFFKLIKARFDVVDSVDPSKIHPLSVAQTGALLDLVRNFVILVVISILLYYLILILSCSLLKGLIWLKITNKKLTKKFWPLMSLANLITGTFFTLLFIGALWILKKPGSIIAAVIIAILMIHYSILTFIFFVHENKPVKSIGLALSQGTKKAKYFVIPYIIVAVGIAIIISIARLVKNPLLIYPILLITLTLYLAGARIFIYESVKQHLPLK